MQVDFLFDFSSPNAYLAHKMIPGIEQRTGVEFTYVPCLLGGIFNATNNQSPMQKNADVANKIAYDRMEFQRFIARHDMVDFRFNPNFPLRTVFLMRAAMIMQSSGGLRAFVDAGMQMAWEDQINVGDPETAAKALEQHGFEGTKLLEETSADAVKSQLFEATQSAVERGAFGMPTFYVGDEMFFGKDRLREVEDAINAQRKTS